jgi:PAS domain S-box-containing protein
MSEIQNNKNESRFEAIFNNVNEGILIVGSDGKMILMNPRGLQMFGYDEGEIRGQYVEMLVPRDAVERHADYREAYMRTPVKRAMGKNLTLNGRRKNGTNFPVEISLSYYESAEGLYAIAFIIDITERYTQQERIQKINEELKSLNESLERKVGERTLVLKEALHDLEISRDELADSLEKEKELNEIKSRFLSMASHEFRTPLSTILSSATLISKYVAEDDDHKRLKHVDRIRNAVTSLTEILNDFLSLGKLEEGKVLARKSMFDYVQVIEDLINELQAILLKGQEIRFYYSGEREVWMDKNIFRNILLNLLSNAIKFSPEESKVDILVSIDERSMQLSVKDYGMGIPVEDQKHLFGRFFRAKNVSNIQGTGLGLNIVGKYLEMLEGDITFESEIGKGSIFTITIPITKNEDQHTDH